ncbi:MAG: hypothetical protein HKO07_00910 [Pseudomonadales bacterium]|nr:hypothetical protein [Pseudomonadales bacterium]
MAACGPGKQEFSDQLLGSWLIETEKAISCTRFYDDGGEFRRIKIYAQYHGADAIGLKKGYYYTARGRRWWDHTDVIYDRRGRLIAPEQRSGHRRFFYALELDEVSMTFVKADTKGAEKSIAYRTDSCDKFAAQLPEHTN